MQFCIHVLSFLRHLRWRHLPLLALLYSALLSLTLALPLSVRQQLLRGQSVQIAPGVWYEPHKTYIREPIVYQDGTRGMKFDDLDIDDNATLPNVRLGSRMVSRWTKDRVIREDLGGLDNWLDMLSRVGTDTSNLGRPTGELKTITGKKSVFEILYIDGLMPGEYRNVFEFSARKWADNFDSLIPIRVSVAWTSLGKDTLGEAMTPINVDGQSHARLKSDVRYGSALAAALTGKDFALNGNSHVLMRFNAPTRWHLDISTDAPKDKWDFATVVLHELTHGLFFSGAIEAIVLKREASYHDDVPSRFDKFITATAGGSWDKSCSKRNRFLALTEPGLRFINGATNTNMSLYAPQTYENGSSTYHLDNKRFRGDCKRQGISEDDCSDLMTPQLLDGYTQREIGENTLSILRAMRSDGDGVPEGSCKIGTGLATPEDKEANANGLLSSRFQIPTWGIYALAGIGALGVVAFLASVATCFKRGASRNSNQRKNRNRNRNKNRNHQRGQQPEDIQDLPDTLI